MTTTPSPERRHDLDWLRVSACYLLLLFHVLMVFSPAPFYHVRNDEQSVLAMIVAGFISLWHMPLLFLLAGWSLYGSLQGRGLGRFLHERVTKLAIPLVAGCILLAPGIKYLELRSGLDLNHEGLKVAPHLQEGFKAVIPDGLPLAEPFDESFAEFLPSFFTDIDRFSWSHLWFVAYLLTFTLLYLPLFLRLARSRGNGRVRSALWLYAPLVPLVAIQLTLRERFPGPYNLYQDWANFSYYSTFLFAGFLLARHPALDGLIAREWKRALAIGIAAALVLLLFVLGVVRWPPLVLVGSAVAAWCFVLALLGIASIRLRAPTAALPYLVESAYPIYILHQPVIVVLGFGIVALPLGIASKFVLLLAASVAGTMLLYHQVARRNSALRFLLGMRPKRSTPLAAISSPSAIAGRA